jgi:SP family sugar:H+ symporter-like MFS transporter
MSLSTASNWSVPPPKSPSLPEANISRFWNFLLAFFTPFIVGDIDFRYGYVFAACNVLGGLIVYFFVIEGQGRTVEELDTMYIEKVVPWQSTKWVAPPPEVMDQIREKAGTGGGEPLARAESGIAPVPMTREQNGVEHPAMEKKEEEALNE